MTPIKKVSLITLALLLAFATEHTQAMHPEGRAPEPSANSKSTQSLSILNEQQKQQQAFNPVQKAISQAGEALDIKPINIWIKPEAKNSVTKNQKNYLTSSQTKPPLPNISATDELALLDANNTSPTSAVTTSSTSKVPNSDGSTTTITQDGFKLTLIQSDIPGKIFGGTAGKAQVFDFSTYVNQLKQITKPQDAANIIDEMTLQLTGRDNLFSSKIVDEGILKDPGYIAFRKSIVDELTKRIPQDQQSWYVLLSKFFLRILNIKNEYLRATEKSIQDQSITANKKALTDAIANNKNLSIVPPESTNLPKGAKILADGSLQLTDGSVQIKITNKITNTTTTIKLNGDDTINKTSGGTVVYQADTGFVIISGKSQLIMNPFTGIFRSLKSILNGLPGGKSKQIVTVDPTTGDATTTTFAKDNVTPVSKSVRGLDGSVQFYKANKGVIEPAPTSVMTVGPDGTITVITTKIQKAVLYGNKPPVTSIVIIDPAGKITTQGFSEKTATTFKEKNDAAPAVPAIVVTTKPLPNDAVPTPTVDQSTVNSNENVNSSNQSLPSPSANSSTARDNNQVKNYKEFLARSNLKTYEEATANDSTIDYCNTLIKSAIQDGKLPQGSTIESIFGKAALKKEKFIEDTARQSPLLENTSILNQQNPSTSSPRLHNLGKVANTLQQLQDATLDAESN